MRIRSDTVSSSASSISTSKEDGTLGLYCINIRGRHVKTSPELCVRKLSQSDNLFHIENANRLLTEFVTRRNDLIENDALMSPAQRYNWMYDHALPPDFRYVYCTQAMVRQIVSAF